MAKKRRGRPSGLTQELMEKANTYLAWCEAHPLIKTVFTKNGPQQLKVPKPPTITGLSLYLDVSRDSLDKWSKENMDFADIFMRVRKTYENVLVENGLTEGYNGNLSKFLLSADHNKREKTEQDITSKGQSIIGMKIVQPK
jgi:DNA-packaging protein gp3